MTVFASTQQRSVADAARAMPAARLSSAFNDFLYATVTQDSGGMPLSVLSALARSGVDPWQEAAILAGLPREAAIQRLTALIAALPGGTTVQPGPATNIAALIAFLPRRSDPATESRQGASGGAIAPGSLAVAYVLLVILMMGTQWLLASHESAAAGDVGHTGSAAAAAPLSPGTGRP